MTRIYDHTHLERWFKIQIRDYSPKFHENKALFTGMGLVGKDVSDDVPCTILEYTLNEEQYKIFENWAEANLVKT